MTRTLPRSFAGFLPSKRKAESRHMRMADAMNAALRRARALFLKKSGKPGAPKGHCSTLFMRLAIHEGKRGKMGGKGGIGGFVLQYKYISCFDPSIFPDRDFYEKEKTAIPVR